MIRNKHSPGHLLISIHADTHCQEVITPIDLEFSLIPHEPQGEDGHYKHAAYWQLVVHSMLRNEQPEQLHKSCKQVCATTSDMTVGMPETMIIKKWGLQNFVADIHTQTHRHTQTHTHTSIHCMEGCMDCCIIGLKTDSKSVCQHGE